MLHLYRGASFLVRQPPAATSTMPWALPKPANVYLFRGLVMVLLFDGV